LDGAKADKAETVRHTKRHYPQAYQYDRVHKRDGTWPDPYNMWRERRNSSFMMSTIQEYLEQTLMYE
jgi:hypothetical protein